MEKCVNCIAQCKFTSVQNRKYFVAKPLPSWKGDMQEKDIGQA